MATTKRVTDKRKAGDPERKAKLLKVYETLKKVRESETVTLKLSKYIRPKFEALDGTLQDFHLRYYQVQGAYHLLVLKRMLLGDDTGLGKCVVGSTWLTTDRGLFPISVLAPDSPTPDTFYEPRIPLRVWSGSDWNTVRRFYWNGEVPTKKVTTRNGYVLEGSRVHPLLVRDRWSGTEHCVALQDLDPERHVVCIDRTCGIFPKEEPFIPEPPQFKGTPKPYAWPSSLSPALARLLGYVVAEAWSASTYTLSITQHRDINPEVHDDIRALLQMLYGWSGNQDNKDRDITILVSSLLIREHLRSCGVGSELSAGKAIPWIILQGTEESNREFLRGLLDAEGSVAPDGGYEFSSASKELAFGVHQLLLRFGIVSRLAPKPVLGREHTYWRVSFFGDDARLFLQRVGLVSSRKFTALLEVLDRPSNTNKNLVPGFGELFAGVRRKLGNISRFGHAFRSTLLHVAKGRRNPSYSFLKTLHAILKEASLPEAELLGQTLQQNYFYDPIATIEDGFETVMDIEVESPRHLFVGNGFVNHNTVQAIVACCHMFERTPATKVLVVTPKSTVGQWAGEFRRFTQGIDAIPVSVSSKGKKGEAPLEQRKALYEAWAAATTPTVMVMNYAVLVRDWNAEGFQPVDQDGKPDPKQPVVLGVLNKIIRDVSKNHSLVVIWDEAQAFRNPKTKTWEIARATSDIADRAYALTATPIKSRLMEIFGIYKAIKPELFGTKTSVMKRYCVTKLQAIPGSKQKIPIIVGYKNLEHFRHLIDPFYYGRYKSAVASELPTLIPKDITCELSEAENRKYGEAVSGVLELGDGEIKDYEENRALVALVYCQKVVDSMSLLKFEEDSVVGTEFDGDTLDMEDVKVGTLGAKEQALLDLLCIDGELEDEKVIVYTRFASLVPRLQKVLERQKIKSVRITGKVSEAKRQEAQALFQDSKSDVRVIFITDAGGVGINLQMARALIFYDLPWTWGDYVQVLGRMIRIGSPHKGVVVYHLMAERPYDTKASRKTIDHHVLALLREKKNLIDKVLGEGIEGALEFDKSNTSTRLLLKAMQEAAA